MLDKKTVERLINSHEQVRIRHNDIILKPEEYVISGRTPSAGQDYEIRYKGKIIKDVVYLVRRGGIEDEQPKNTSKVEQG